MIPSNPAALLSSPQNTATSLQGLNSPDEDGRRQTPTLQNRRAATATKSWRSFLNLVSSTIL
jgi:hypothetical protein